MDQSTQQSVEYYEGEGPVHRSVKSPNQLLATSGHPSLYHAIAAGFEANANRTCIGRREKGPDGSWGPFKFQSYQAVRSQYEALAAGLRSAPFNLVPQSHFGIYAKNRPEWLLGYLAALSQNITLVPLYDTLGPDATQYVINHAEISVVLSSYENLKKLLKSAADTPSLRSVIIMEPLITEEDQAAAGKFGIKLYPLEQVMAAGAKATFAPEKSASNDLFMIMYTSGTTGVPKGVMITQANILAALTAIEKQDILLNNTDVHLSYLPLAHIFEMVVTSVSLTAGVTIGYWRGDVSGLIEDIAALRPTVLVGAPRVFNTIYDKVQNQLSQVSVFRRSMFQYAFGSKLAQIRQTGDGTSFWNKIVFNKLADILGGRVRMIISGSAPLAPNVQEFLRVAFNCDVVQGYGMTETTAIISVTAPRDTTGGHVGGPCVTTEVKLVDVTEMNYLSNGPIQQGEICVRGPNIFVGYYKMPEKTAAEIDRDGWFHTGDIGQWLPNGSLRIIDRKKNIFKLAQGEYVAAEFLETVYLRSEFVATIFVYGDSFKNYLVALIVVDMEALGPAAAAIGVTGTPQEICQNPKVRALVFESVMRVGSDANLKGFEKVRNIYLDWNPWTIDNDMLTPTLKLKRASAQKHYQTIIDQLYDEPRLDVKKAKL